MNLFVFAFAVAIVATFMALSPKGNVQHYPDYSQQYNQHSRTSQHSGQSNTSESPLMTLMYTIIFVSAMMMAMYALA